MIFPLPKTGSFAEPVFFTWYDFNLIRLYSTILFSR
jgi:hypothetical protein